jgi:hypothetical protein
MKLTGWMKTTFAGNYQAPAHVIGLHLNLITGRNRRQSRK